MKELFGLEVIRLEAPQDRSELTFQVIDEDKRVFNVRFSNKDDSKIEVDFSHLTLSIIWDEDSNIVSFGEFELVREIDNGFEIIGDFGLIWVFCNKCVPPLAADS
ncbi:hypothetical protein R50072_36830 [Simiduia litorea]|uniref:hypothetical protein n=1 Tax=Simiduia litorea TaxID=1435348 RepID=UPI0036F19FB5